MKQQFSDTQRAIDPLMRDEDSNLLFEARFSGTVSHKKVAEFERACWDAGAPTRDYVVSAYLSTMKPGVLIHPDLSLAFLLAPILAFPLTFAENWGARIALLTMVAISIPMLRQLWRGSVLWDRSFALLVGSENRVSEVDRRRLRSPIRGYFWGMIVGSCGSYLLMFFSLLTGLGTLLMTATPSPPRLSNMEVLACGMGFLVVGFIAKKSAAFWKSYAREMQSDWLAFATRMHDLIYARTDDPSDETDAWFDWLHSPLRDPAAPAPELDEKWKSWLAANPPERR